MTPPILARVAQLHGSSDTVDCDTISSATSWEYVSKSSSLSDLTRFGAAFSSSSSTNNHQHPQQYPFSQSALFSSSAAAASPSSASTTNQNNYVPRSILPHGIVPLPPPHRSAHHPLYHSHNINGFHGYRLTQKDLLQPPPQQSQQPLSQENVASSNVPLPVRKDDSIPVMRSTSFNLDCGAARKHTQRFRQTPLTETGAPNQQRKGRPQQKAIVFVAENPENGACDVYNVPFQSDIYSLPVDSIGATAAAPSGGKKVGRSNSICTSKLLSSSNTATSTTSAALALTSAPKPILSPLAAVSTTATKASSSNNLISQQNNHNTNNYNQNQRFNLCDLPPPPTAAQLAVSSSGNLSVVNTNSNNSEGATPPPPQRKNNLNRRVSREENINGGSGNHVLESCNIKCSPPPSAPQPQHQTQASPNQEACKPPQRWSSLSSQPASSTSLVVAASVSPPIKELPLEPHSSKTFSKILPPPPPLHSHSKNALSESSENKSTNNYTSNYSACAGKTLNTSVAATTSTSTNVSKSKPRSRSVDPAQDKTLAEHHIQNIKYSAAVAASSTITTNANQRTSTNNLNYIDNPNNHPLPPEPVEVAISKENHATTTDRRNPLGLSILNLFRRNKNGGGSSCTTATTATPTTSANGKTQGTRATTADSNGQPEFTSLVPASTTSAEDENRTAGAGNNLANNNNNKEDTSYYFRELPPPPPGEQSEDESAVSDDQNSTGETSPLECRDFAASIERVKDCGWYWGPISSEAAEDLLKNEPDGSFIVRDSSDARYIFSLTFKLHGLVRHVRIEHDQGNFSFGPLTRFKAATIVDFVEKAVAHSRSGRYLFFLHRRPVLGPMQVQLLHPYSRFMHPRSLKHMCRFVILKYVRRDLIHTLPLPKPLQDYLNTPHYYFEPPDRIKNASSGVADGSTASVNGGGGLQNGNGTATGGNHHHHQSTFHPTTNYRVV